MPGLMPEKQPMGEPQAREPLVKNQEVQQRLSEPERAQHVKAYANAMKILYSDAFRKKAAKAIGSATTPAAGIGQVAASIGTRIYQTAVQAKDPLTANVLALAGIDVVQEVGDFAARFAGVEMSDEVLNDAFLIASERMRSQVGRSANQLQGADPEMADRMAQEAGPEEVEAARQRAMAMQSMRMPERQQRGLGGPM